MPTRRMMPGKTRQFECLRLPVPSANERLVVVSAATRGVNPSRAGNLAFHSTRCPASETSAMPENEDSNRLR